MGRKKERFLEVNRQLTLSDYNILCLHRIVDRHHSLRKFSTADHRNCSVRRSRSPSRTSFHALASGFY